MSIRGIQFRGCVGSRVRFVSLSGVIWSRPRYSPATPSVVGLSSVSLLVTSPGSSTSDLTIDEDMVDVKVVKNRRERDCKLIEIIGISIDNVPSRPYLQPIERSPPETQTHELREEYRHHSFAPQIVSARRAHSPAILRKRIIARPNCSNPSESPYGHKRHNKPEEVELSKNASLRGWQRALQRR